MKSLLAAAALAATLGISAAPAQSFSKQAIDTSGLADFGPGANSYADWKALQTHVCEPWLALVKAIRPPPASEHAVLSVADVLQLCGAHSIKDVVCGEAALLELRFHQRPCWDTNLC